MCFRMNFSFSFLMWVYMSWRGGAAFDHPLYYPKVGHFNAVCDLGDKNLNDHLEIEIV